MFTNTFRHRVAAAGLLGALMTLPAPAAAASIGFTGTATNQNSPAAPDPTCAPLPLRVAFGPAGTSGASNFGAFTYTQSHCTAGPGPYGGGVFQFLFAADMFSGTYSGALSPSATPGLLDNTISYVIQQGTGRFADATGTINGTGTLDVRLPMPVANLTLTGAIETAVPEPATWAMLIIGFGAVGGALRQKSRTQTPALAG